MNLTSGTVIMQHKYRHILNLFLVNETIELDKGISPGVYIMKVTIGNKTESSRLLLTK